MPTTISAHQGMRCKGLVMAFMDFPECGAW
jgi:hypothetical protein